MSGKLKTKRAGHRGVLTKLLRKAEGDSEELIRQYGVNELSTIREMIRKKEKIISELNEQILDAIEEEEMQAEIEDADNYAYDIENVLTKLTKIIQDSETATVSSKSQLNPQATEFQQTYEQIPNEPQPSFIPQTSTSAFTNTSMYHKLPKLSLPTFGGNLLEWQPFWDSFSAAVHDNLSLNDVQKFNYLKSQLYGEANKCIAGLQITNTNYGQALHVLKMRFGQTHKIVNAYMQSLINLPSPTSDTAELKEFYDNMENYIRGLESIGETQESFGSLLVPIILNKLPGIVKENLVRAHGTDRWNLSSLRDAIMQEITIKEAGQSAYSDSIQTEFTPTSAFIASARRNNGHKREVRNLATKPCIFCKDVHAPSNCPKVKGVDERKRIVKEKQLCYNCLGNHKVAECKSEKSCKNCKKRHHTSICTKNETKNQSNAPKANSSSEPTNSEPVASMHSFTSSVRSHVLLKTAIAPASADRHNFNSANVLLDEGAQRSFITQDLAKKLNLTPHRTETLTISGFGESNRKVRHLDEATVFLQATNLELVPINVLIVPQIAHPISVFTRNQSSYPYLTGLKLAHPIAHDGEFEISILVGADFYWNIVGDKVIRGQGPTAVASKLGYLLSGPTHEDTSRNGNVTTSSIMNIITPHRHEECELHKFWEIESYGTKCENESTKSAKTEMEEYQESSVFLQDNKYIAKFPWRPEHPELPSNEAVAKIRTLNVINRLVKDPHMLKIYGDIIKDQESKGFIEKIETTECEKNSRIHYIPHHPVNKESSTTPIRIVYDCSCRQDSESPSLNDCLSSTPPLLNQLTDILTRFRVGKYAITTDIEKAFLQIGLAKEDRDSTRFFWLSDPSDPKSRLDTYRFKVVLFGATCSPFILNATMLKHLTLNPCETSEILQRDLYVDNVLTSVDTDEAALNFFTDSRKLLKKGGFNLRTWKSNNKKLMDKAAQEKVIDTDTDTKILGMLWNATTDTLTFANRQFEKNILLDDKCEVTKRDILRESSSIYDPLGLLGPVTIRAKILIQSLWKEGFDWDEVLPSDLLKSWRDIRMDIQNVISNTQISRHYFTKSKMESIENSEITLHVFVDASQRAYGASAYLCKGDISTLVLAKNRVAPVKEVTLPRLELMAAVLGSRIASQLIRNLDIHRAVFWSDSQIVLHWITSTKSYEKFVQNRVKEIRELTQNFVWKYVPTDSNPADLQTRGITAQQYKDSTLWMQGPSWITDENQWPSWTPNMTSETTLMTTTNEKEADSSQNELPGISKIIELARFSTLGKLLRITCYVLKFVKSCRTKKRYNLRSQTTQGNITRNDIQQATLLWIKDIQSERFKEEKEHIRNNTKGSSVVRQLRLYIDDEKIIRSAGRIHNSELDDNTKFPILLPRKHKFTDLIIMEAHEKTLHAGAGQTIAHIRQTYWIPSIRQCVNYILNRCIKCRKITGKPYRKPDSPPLPRDRVTEMIPFATTGVDFAGPLYVKENGLSVKNYVCLFTCACIRAIHLELVPDMTLEAFMLALRRFISRRGIPKTMYSDNAPTFKSAENEISRSLNIHINWKFIPRAAPWYGGWWERLVGLTKITLRKVLGKAQVNADTLRTIITEIECMINDRPITFISSDIRDPQPLTPSHLLQGRRISSPEEDHSREVEDDSDIDFKPTEANRMLQRKVTLIEHFSKRWKTEYLTGLREFHRASGENSAYVKQGSVVQIMDNSPRHTWKLGIIQDVITGTDGLVRAAKIRSSNGLISIRPIVKLVPLEI